MLGSEPKESPSRRESSLALSNQLKVLILDAFEVTIDIFDEIRVTQSGGGGFESDNYSFKEGTGAFDITKTKDVPEPTVTLGLMAMGGAFLLKRGRKQLA